MLVFMHFRNQQPWPNIIWIARHGESAGNVARREAEAAGHPLIEISARDIDVPLSPVGERQAGALGGWFGRMTPEEQPPFGESISMPALAVALSAVP